MSKTKPLQSLTEPHTNHKLKAPKTQTLNQSNLIQSLNKLSEVFSKRSLLHNNKQKIMGFLHNSKQKHSILLQGPLQHTLLLLKKVEITRRVLNLGNQMFYESIMMNNEYVPIASVYSRALLQ